MTNCHPEEPSAIIITHYITSIFSIPVYGCAFLVLFFKCPEYFNAKYRNYLVAHISSGVLLEIHMSVFWRATIPLPVPILCSNGLSSNYSAADFQIFVYLLMFTGVSALSILIHRMKAAILHAEDVKISKIPIYFRILFYVFSILCIISTFLINPGLNNQMEYKLKMEKKFEFPFPDYFWCRNCIFMVFDSIYFVGFFITAFSTTVTAALSAGLSAFVTYRILHSSSLRLSRKTAAIQKNLLFSLIAAFLVHLVLIVIPLFLYFCANFIFIDSPITAYMCFLMIQEHGSCSVLTLLITSNLLRKATGELLSIPKRYIWQRNERTSQTPWNNSGESQ